MTITCSKCGVWLLEEMYQKIGAGCVPYIPCTVCCIWGWGSNSPPQFNDSTKAASAYASPIQINGVTWCNFSFPLNSNWHGIKYDDTLWGIGENVAGELGVGDKIAYSSPVQIPGTRWWRVVSAGGFPASNQIKLALKCNGTLWAWGDGNNGGGLGNNTKAAYSSPIQIPGTSWCCIFSKTLAVFAMKTDNTLWGWGLNAGSQLGDSSAIDRSSPIQIPGLTWCLISGGGSTSQVTGGLKTDGTLWTWGNASNGEHANNIRVTNRSSPVQVPGITWCDLSIDGLGSVFGLKTNCTLWAWGCSSWGQLGLDGRVSYSSPVQVPGTNWCKITSYEEATAGLKTDGTLWMWGCNSAGMLGLGITTSSSGSTSSPTQVPGTTWNDVKLGKCSTLAFKT